MMLAARAPSAACVRAPRRTAVRVSAQAQAPTPAAPVSRRSTAAALLGLAALPLLLTPSAEARDAKEAAKAAEARKAKLRDAAKKMSESGKGGNVFATSKYGLPEAATTPNMRSSANKGKEE